MSVGGGLGLTQRRARVAMVIAAPVAKYAAPFLNKVKS